MNLSTPTPTGDYNGNHVVDAADYVLWRNTLNQTVTAGSGADGNADGTINAADYDFLCSKVRQHCGKRQLTRRIRSSGAGFPILRHDRRVAHTPAATPLKTSASKELRLSVERVPSDGIDSPVTFNYFLTPLFPPTTAQARAPERLRPTFLSLFLPFPFLLYLL